MSKDEKAVIEFYKLYHTIKAENKHLHMRFCSRLGKTAITIYQEKDLIVKAEAEKTDDCYNRAAKELAEWLQVFKGKERSSL